MNADLPRAITPDETAAYHRSGVVLLPETFDGNWIGLLKRELVPNCGDTTMIYDNQA